MIKLLIINTFILGFNVIAVGALSILISFQPLMGC